MKPTDEERRHVAKDLRALADRNRGVLGGRMMAFVLDAAKDATGTKGLCSVADVLERYADLIEPTERVCRAEERYRDDDSSPWPYYVCSECGERMRYREAMDEDCEMLPYCAGCGAKVVEE